MHSADSGIVIDSINQFQCATPFACDVPAGDSWCVLQDAASPSGWQIVALDHTRAPVLLVALPASGIYEILVGLYSPDLRCSGIFAKLSSQKDLLFLRPAAEREQEPYQEISLGIHRIAGEKLEIRQPYEYRSYITHVRLLPVAAIPENPPAEKLVLGLADVWHYFYFFGSYEADAIRNLVYQHAAWGFTHLVYEIGRSCMNYETKCGDPYFYDAFRPRTRLNAYQTRFHTPLQTAARACREYGLQLWGRLGMNIHYARNYRGTATSRFALEHPEFWETDQQGKRSARQLCFGYPEVRAERVAIWREAVELGITGLFIDTMRYMPMADWGRPYVEGFRAAYGRMPVADDPEWQRHRAGGFTDLLSETKRMLAEIDRADTPMALRIPAVSTAEVLRQGVDLEALLAHKLITHLILGEAKEAIGAEVIDEYATLAQAHGVHLLPCYMFHGTPLPGPEHHRAGDWPAVTYSTPDISWSLPELTRAYEKDTLAGVAFYESDEAVMFGALREFFWACRRPRLLAEMMSQRG